MGRPSVLRAFKASSLHLHTVVVIAVVVVVVVMVGAAAVAAGVAGVVGVVVYVTLLRTNYFNLTPRQA